MYRPLLTATLACSLTVVFAGPALAGSCPKLVAQINAASGNRFDKAAQDARAKAAEADKLHKEGKHEDSEKAAKDGLALLGIKS
jgi:hypothetical protein